MTKAKSTKTKRGMAADPPHAILTGAEARGEAAYLVVGLLLPELPQSMCKRIMGRAYLEADALGIPVITEEVECLFAKVQFEPPLR